jgi:Protein of unknown function (DUF1580)
MPVKQSTSQPAKSNSHILTESVLALKEVSSQLPSRPCFATVWRWATHGCRGRKLETYRVGKLHLTSKEALHRFLESAQ